MGAAIGDMAALGAVGWVNPWGSQWGAMGWVTPLGSPWPQELWDGCAHWGHSGGYGMGDPIGVTVVLGAMGSVIPLGSPWHWEL